MGEEHCYKLMSGVEHKKTTPQCCLKKHRDAVRSERGDSNARPPRPERGALPTALLSEAEGSSLQNPCKGKDFHLHDESFSLLFHQHADHSFRATRVIADEQNTVTSLKKVKVCIGRNLHFHALARSDIRFAQLHTNTRIINL